MKTAQQNKKLPQQRKPREQLHPENLHQSWCAAASPALSRRSENDVELLVQIQLSGSFCCCIKGSWIGSGTLFSQDPET